MKAVKNKHKNRRYNIKGGKEQAKEYYEKNKQDCKNKLEINIANYLVKTKISKENMKEIDREIYLRKINKN